MQPVKANKSRASNRTVYRNAKKGKGSAENHIWIKRLHSNDWRVRLLTRLAGMKGEHHQIAQQRPIRAGDNLTGWTVHTNSNCDSWKSTNLPVERANGSIEQACQKPRDTVALGGKMRELELPAEATPPL